MTDLLKNVYVINLERSRDRLNNIDSNLKKYNINYKRFNAIDGKNLSLDIINNNTTLLCRYFLCNRSLIGCALSHITLWEEISKQEDKWHLILEDDIEFSNNTIKFLKKLEESSIINEDNIIISLSCIGPLCTELSYNSSSEIIQPIFPLGTPAYLITKNSAKKLYEYFINNKINYHIDFQIAWNHNNLGIKYLTIEPAVVNLSDNNSTIGPQSMYILANILNYLGFNRLVWHLSVPLITINLSFSINGFIILWFLLLLLNIIIIHSVLLFIYLLFESIIYIILMKNY